jgi:hypothetical protein
MKRVANQTRVYEYDQINGKLGSGAFAEVYKAKMLQLDIEVAIKVINK